MDDTRDEQDDVTPDPESGEDREEETHSGPDDSRADTSGEAGAGGGGAAGATRDLAEAARGGEDAMTPEESERLAREIHEELEEMEQLRDRHLRLAAEFENYRKRTRREMNQARERAQAELAERLLDALDDLNRVLEAPPDSVTVESLREGVEMVARKLEKELGEAGLSRIEAEGQKFDPEVHEALLTTPVDDAEKNDVISRVLISGYTFGDRVIRPARVEVQKFSGEAPEDGNDGNGDG